MLSSCLFEVRKHVVKSLRRERPLELDSGLTEKKIYCCAALQILEPLELCYRSLIETGDRPIADGSLLDFMRQASVFGLSLVKLDIRQESERHTDVLDAITTHLGIGSYRDWSEDKRQVKAWYHERIRSTVLTIHN
jgi:phosphoenolpyruvate carboxylase